MRRVCCLLLGVSCGWWSGCQKLRPYVKAKPAELSAFLPHRRQMVRRPAKAAFQWEWRTRDQQQQRLAAPIRQLYVAPVTLKYLRAARVGVGRWEQDRGGTTDPAAPEIARRLRDAVIIAFQKSPTPRYTVVSRPSRETLTLELAITELARTRTGGNTAKLGAKILLGPIGSLAGLSLDTSGVVAMEGKVTLSATGTPLYEFADQEKDKLTLYTLRDFAPYGHNIVSLEEWARQIEEISRTPPSQPVEDSTFWTLMPF